MSDDEPTHFKCITTNEIQILDEAGNMRMELLADSGGEPTINFYDKKGVARVMIGIDGADWPHVSILDSKSKVAGTISLRGDTEKYMCIMHNGKMVFAAGIDINGKEFFKVPSVQQ